MAKPAQSNRHAATPVAVPRFSARLIAALVLLNLLAIALGTLSIAEGRRKAVAHAETTTHNLVTAVEQSLAGLIARIDLLLTTAKDEIEGNRAVAGNTRRVNEFLVRQNDRIHGLLSLRVLDAKGRVVLGTGVIPSVNNSDREYFIRTRDEPDAGLVVGKPLLSRTNGVWVLTFSRRLEKADGSFDGIVYASIGLDTIAALFAHINVGKKGGIGLRDTEMGLIVRVPELEGIGAKIGDKSVSRTIKDYVAEGRTAATYTAVTPADGEERTASFRRVGDWPLYTIVTLASSEYLAEWRRESLTTLVLLLAIVAASLGIGRVLLRTWRSQLRLMAELTRSRQLFQTVTEFSDDWVYWRSADRRSFHYLSPFCEDITGYSVAEFQADPGLLDRIVHPDDRERWDRHLDHDSAEEQTFEEYRIVGKHGDIRWIRHICREVVAEDGTSLGRRGSNQDITANRGAELALQQSERLLREAQEIGRIGSYGYDIRNDRWESSEVLDEIFGIATDYPRDLAGWLQLIHPQERESMQRYLNDCMANRSRFSREYRIVRPDGVERWVHGMGEFSYGADGAPLRLVGVIQDISGRKRSENDLREHDARTRALLDASSESTMLLDTRGTILAINTVGARRFALTPEAMTERNLFDFLPPALAETRRALLRQVLADREPLHTRDQRGAMRFDLNLFPVMNREGQVDSIALYAKDVTEEERNERIDALFHRLDLMLLKWHMNLDSIAQMFCEEICLLFDLDAAWIGRAEQDGNIAVVAAAGESQEFLAAVRQNCRRWRGEPDCCQPAGIALREHHLQKTAIDAPECAACRDAARGADIVASLMLPLMLRSESWGVLALYTRHGETFDRADIPPRLTAVAGRLAVSLESALQQEWLTLLETALASTGNAVFITGGDGRILWCNEAFNRLSGYATADVVGKTPQLFRSGDHGQAFYDDLWATIRSGKVWRGEVVNCRPDGSRYTINQVITPLQDANGKVSHYVAIIEDISERKANEARIEHMANYDSLTELPNRNLFFDRLAVALAQARRSGRPGALLYFDLDRFKPVNDRLGHAAGDKLLKAVADRVGAQMRASDTFGRLAGDEFAVILPDASRHEDAAHVAEKILAAVDQPFDIDGQQVEIGASIGIAVIPADGASAEEVLKAADEAMYQAKAAGRNTYRNYCRT